MFCFKMKRLGIISVLNREDGEWRRDIMRLDEMIMLEKEASKLEGIQQGISEERVNIAKKLKQNGIDINIIVENTGLTKEEIEKL